MNKKIFDMKSWTPSSLPWNSFLTTALYTFIYNYVVNCLIQWLGVVKYWRNSSICMMMIKEISRCKSQSLVHFSCLFFFARSKLRRGLPALSRRLLSMPSQRTVCLTGACVNYHETPVKLCRLNCASKQASSPANRNVYGDVRCERRWKGCGVDSRPAQHV